jgi:hypothetical protein
MAKKREWKAEIAAKKNKKNYSVALKTDASE